MIYTSRPYLKSAKCALAIGLTLILILNPWMPVSAEVMPAGIFTDGTVLQQGESVRVWGTADAGEEVAVEFAGQRVSTKASVDGKWIVTLKPMAASAEPREMVFYSGEAKRLALSDVLVGEVWLAGGQSNMAGIMRSYRAVYQSYIDDADDPLLRFATIPRLEYEGQNEEKPQWLPTTPENIGGFSATAYFFARNLREKLGVPVGIVSCSVGATPAEAWMSRETLTSTPSLKRIVDAYDAHARENCPDLGTYLRMAAKQKREFRDWEEKRRAGVKPLPRRPGDIMGPGNFKRPCGLYETMLRQTIPYTVKGVIWYQGENNANSSAGFHYRTVFPALIEQWRAEFLKPEMPFLFVQLATFGPADDTTAKWPELRDAQLWTEEHVDNCGMVVMADGGDINNIHPRTKDKVGLRLSLLARHMAYGEKDLVCRGPRVEKVSAQEDQITLTFTQIGSGLVLETVESTPFEICGKDGKYVSAEAKLQDDKIIVSAKGVKDPQHVRYGWKKWFEPTVFNKEGLPSSPFKTDNFEPETKDGFYLDNL